MELNLRELPFCGRHKELITLRKAFNAWSGESTFHIALVQGESGIGKSRLIDEFVTSLLDCQEQQHILGQPLATMATTKEVVICRGKYDQNSFRSFGAVAENIEQIIQMMLDDDPKTWRQRLMTDTANDYKILIPIISNLRHLLATVEEKQSTELILSISQEKVGDRTSRREGGSTVGIVQRSRFSTFGMRRDLEDDASSLASEMSSIHNFSEARSKAGRIVAAIRNLMEIWSKYNPQPLIFVCDDLQWADRNSLALFSQLAKNPHEMPYFFIATVRGDLETMYPLNKQIKDIGSYPYVHCMLLSPLDAMEISRIIAQVLRKDVEEIQPLGEVLHSKTGGNPFVLVEFMELLTSKQFIYYSLQTYTWEWNLKQISSQTDVSENIAKLVLENLDTLDPNVKTVLARAAAIGLSVFSSCLLLETLQDDLECVSTLSELERYLSIAAKDGFLEHVDRHFGTWSVYKFSHDKVKESTASLLPCGDEKKALHFSIGNRMMAALSTLKIQKTENFADVYMLAMLHINSALDLAMALPDDEERCYLAKCNYHAAEMALDTASYQLASNYLEAGLSLLDRNNNDDSWNSNYDLKYILCNAGCFIFFSCGEAKKCEKMINEVLDHARSLEEKLPAYNILIWHKMQHESGDEALEVTREVIVMLYGHRFPVSFPNLRIMRGFIFLKRKLSNLTDDEILGLKDINDPTQVRVVEFLNTFVTIGTFSSNPASSILGAMKAIQFTLKNGVCAGSDFAFATMAALFGKFLFIDESYRMGQLAIKLSERTKSPMIQARTIAWATVFGIHFKTPLMSCLNRSLEAAMTMQRECDTRFLSLGVMGYVLNYYYSGLPLEPLLADIQNMRQMLIDFGQTLSISIIECRAQLVHNLMGKGKGKITDLSGDFFEQDLGYNIMVQRGDKKPLLQLYACRMYLAYYFDDLELAEELHAKLVNGNADDVQPTIILPTLLLFTGLIFMGRYKTTSRRHYLQKANRIIKKCSKMVRLGCVNFPHVLVLLQAQRKSIEDADHTPSVQKAFDKAIVFSGRAGHLSVHAMANELAFECFRERDQDLSKIYLRRSLELYSQWGAHAKVLQLWDKYGDLLPNEQDGNGGLVFRGSAASFSGTSVLSRSRLEQLSSSSLSSHEFVVPGE